MIVLRRATAAEKIVRLGVRRGVIIISGDGFAPAHGMVAQSGGIGERFDSAGDVAEGIGWGALVAQRP